MKPSLRNTVMLEPQEVVEWQADAVVTTPAELTQLFESMDF